LKSVDTNVVVRLLLADDPAQSGIARQIIRPGVFLPITVLLETGWLLGSFYKFSRVRLVASLLGLLDMPEIHVADEPNVRAAINHFGEGGDFADAIHLVAARGTDAFINFDKGVRSSEVIGMSVELVG
jgi:predicted nucleic-acid-binding protein